MAGESASPPYPALMQITLISVTFCLPLTEIEFLIVPYEMRPSFNNLLHYVFPKLCII